MLTKEYFTDSLNQLRLDFCSLEQDVIKSMNRYHELMDRYNYIYKHLILDFEPHDFMELHAVSIGSGQWEEDIIKALGGLRTITANIAIPDGYTVSGYENDREESRKQNTITDDSPGLNWWVDKRDNGGTKND